MEKRKLTRGSRSCQAAPIRARRFFGRYREDDRIGPGFDSFETAINLRELSANRSDAKHCLGTGGLSPPLSFRATRSRVISPRVVIRLGLLHSQIDSRRLGDGCSKRRRRGTEWGQKSQGSLAEASERKTGVIERE